MILTSRIGIEGDIRGVVIVDVAMPASQKLPVTGELMLEET
jgi:hypothetical protein